MTELERIHADIAALLDAATEADVDAADCRRQVGRLLVHARAETPTGKQWLPRGMDERTAAMLIQMAAGGREAPGGCV